MAVQHDDTDFDAWFDAALDDSGNSSGPPTLRVVGTDDPPPRRPQIIHNGRQLDDVTRDAINALERANQPPTLFVRSGHPVRVRTDEAGRPIVEQVDTDQMRHHLATCADWWRSLADGGTVATAPPRDVAATILALGAWPFPALTGIVEAPVLRADGTFHLDHGYDPHTRLYHWHHGDPYQPIADHPTADDLAAAVATVEELLGDFPFDTDADRANAWGLITTPIIRPLVGHVMMGLVDAPEPGTGKGLLVSVGAHIATGRPAPLMPLPASDEELEKKLTALLMSGAGLITLDNVEGMIRSHVLAAALTSDTWQGRPLGRSEIIAVPNRAVWAATGNNIDVGGDLARRCYRIRLDARRAQPWKRTGFRHGDLEGHIRTNRSTIIHALCTIIRAWWSAGQPPPRQPASVGTCTRWAHTVGGILDHAGIHGWLTNLDQFHAQADREALSWEGWLTAWHDWRPDEPVTVAELITHMADSQWGSMMREALPDDISGRWGTPGFSRSLSLALRKRSGRHYGACGYRIIEAPRDRRNVAVYTIEQAYPSAGVDRNSRAADSSTSMFDDDRGSAGVDPYVEKLNTPGNPKLDGGDSLPQLPHSRADDTPTEQPPSVAEPDPQPWYNRDDEEPF